ncbi:MAG: GNAT family N-acetyltransferase [Phycisphaerae bacterium]
MFGRLRRNNKVRFIDPPEMIDGDLQLVLHQTRPGDSRGWVPSYFFHMVHPGERQPMGYISLRVGNTPHIVRYGGHIGYRVEPPFRGHHYAARSCRLLLPLAAAHGLDPLWITCNPENIASRKSIERAGGVYVETVDVPADTDIYQRGEFRKCRYRLDLPGDPSSV